MQRKDNRFLTVEEADLIKAELQRQGRWQLWLARQTHIDQPLLNHMLARRRRGPADYFERAMNVLGVRLVRLGNEPEREPASVA